MRDCMRVFFCVRSRAFPGGCVLSAFVCVFVRAFCTGMYSNVFLCVCVFLYVSVCASV